MFNNEEDFFTTRDYIIWKHNRGKYATYYNVKHPAYVEMIINDNPVLRKTVNGIKVKCSNNVNSITAFFNKYVLYSDTQSTGIVNITPANDNFILDQLNSYRYKQGTYNFKVARNVFSTPPTYTFNLINRTVLAPAVAPTVFEQNRIKDTVLHLRLIEDSPTTGDISLQLEAVLVDYNISNR
jgi:hypothetical protein